MSYSESLALRVRQVIGSLHSVTEKKMFGGVGFMLHGNMCVGIWKNSLIARIGADEYESALAQEYVREFDITGRPMKGWILIEPDGVDTNEELKAWVQKAVKFVTTLPTK